MSFYKTITDAIKRLNHLEIVVNYLEFLARPLDVAVDRAVVDVNLVIVRGVHQRVAAFDHARTSLERLQDEKFGDRESDGLALPGAGMSLGVHTQLAALQDLCRIDLLRRSAVFRTRPTQHSLHALDKEPLRERFTD